LSLILIHFDKTAALASQDSPLVAAWQGLSTHPHSSYLLCEFGCILQGLWWPTSYAYSVYVAWVQIYLANTS